MKKMWASCIIRHDAHVLCCIAYQYLVQWTNFDYGQRANVDMAVLLW